MASPWRINAMRERHIGVAAICCPKMYVVFDNGVQLPIQVFLDDDRNPTVDPEKFSYYAFGNEEFGYSIGDYDFYDMVSWEEH